MIDFTGRREAFESKFAHDEALRFKAMLAETSSLGCGPRDSSANQGLKPSLRGTVVMADFEEPGDEDVIRKVVSDLDGAGVPADEDRVRRVLEGFMARATGEIKAGI